MSVHSTYLITLSLGIFLLGTGLGADAQNKTATSPAKPARPAAAKAAQLAHAVSVNGTIADAATGKPVAGIQLSYKDVTASITDSIGNFSLQVPNYNVSITATGEGYQVKEIALQGRKQVTASLYEDAYNSLYDVAYMPFGATPKS